MTDLTAAERAYNQDTFRHIERVRNLLNVFAFMLLKRGETHDQSKLDRPEVDTLMKAPPLHGITFGSAEYEASKKSIDRALQHHYAKNRHHPQHHKNGVADMTLVDVVEMFLDWKASSERHADGNILKSIEKNGHDYGIAQQLIRIFENTAKEMFDV